MTEPSEEDVKRALQTFLTAADAATHFADNVAPGLIGGAESIQHALDFSYEQVGRPYGDTKEGLDRWVRLLSDKSQPALYEKIHLFYRVAEVVHEHGTKAD
jgi:hypothetical protein